MTDMPPKWKEYEIYITRHLRRLFPDADIQPNVRRRGVVSRKVRQVDILVMTDVAGFALSIVIDCKCFSKKVDVKDVEAFLGFLDDLKVSKGIMITNVGYSQTAYDRATYDIKDIELRIINFSDLELFQAFWGIPYSGGHAAILSAPDGWVLDSRPRGQSPVFLYPAGLTWEEAFAGEVHIARNRDRRQPDNDRSFVTTLMGDEVETRREFIAKTAVSVISLNVMGFQLPRVTFARTCC